jgi:hypothetical protein
VIFLITRPFVWLFKLLKSIVTAPFRMLRARRDRKARKDAKFAAQAVKDQAKAAKQTVP